MKKLTNKEKEIMDLYWQHGPMFVRELQEHYADPKPHFNTLSTHYADPKPHFNTLSTLVRLLEKNGFLSHRQFGNTYQYYPVVSENEYGRSSLAGIIRNYFGNSYLSAVSSFVKEEKVSVDELRELLEKIEKEK